MEVGYCTDKSAARTRGATHNDKSVQDPQIHGQYLFEHLRKFCVRSEVLPLCRVLYDRDSTLTVNLNRLRGNKDCLAFFRKYLFVFVCTALTACLWAMSQVWVTHLMCSTLIVFCSLSRNTRKSPIILCFPSSFPLRGTIEIPESTWRSPRTPTRKNSSERTYSFV